ncbi:alpha/beta fold hydrolase [soil metagenome]
MLSLAVAAVAVAVALSAPASAPVSRWPGHASYSVPTARLDGALACHDRAAERGEGRSQPVLLVHGTGMTRAEAWGGSYWPALAAARFDVCWVELPATALGAIQVAAEYVARAIEDLHDAARAPIDVVTHSQGALEARWAIKWFPSGRYVDDYVALGGPEHGTTLAERLTRFHLCSPACWQMRTDARFIAALNRSDETPGPVSYTTLSTSGDEFVRPQATSRLHGARNIVIDRICPGRHISHLALTTDGAVYRLVRDALTDPGPASIPPVKKGLCSIASIPGPVRQRASGGASWPPGALTLHEPALMPYAR